MRSSDPVSRHLPQHDFRYWTFLFLRETVGRSFPRQSNAMKLLSVEIRNFRCFEHFELQLDGESLVVVGANAVGKSSLLTAIKLALVGGEISRADLRDADEAVEITATLGGITPAEQGEFADAMDFNQSPPVLRITQQATWDAFERAVQQNHVFPDDNLRPVSRRSREAIRFLSLPAWRDPARLLSLLGRRSILAPLIDALPLQQEMEEAISALSAAGDHLSDAEPMRELMAKGDGWLARLLPGVEEEAFSIGSLAAEPADVLRQLALHLALGGQRLTVGSQSGGLGQASVFAFALETLASLPDAILLVDEPERALHPQAQRALLTRLLSGDAQGIMATHSAAVLDRRDPRQVAKLASDRGEGATLSRADSIDDTGAATLSRYSTSLVAEAYFAETVIFVEGFSDFLAVRAFAETLGTDLDAAGVSLVSLDGADILKHYLMLFGPSGLNVQLRGLCDLDKEGKWIDLLTAAGIAVADRTDLSDAGFQVADVDLEDELVRALGESVTEQVIDTAGLTGRLTSFEGQPANSGLGRQELLAAFVRTQKIRLAPLLAAQVPDTDIPAPVKALLEEQ